MIKQINFDPRIRLTVTAIEDAIGKPLVLTVNHFNDDTVRDVQNAISHAQTIKQDILPVVINSYGGSAYHLLAMIDLFKQSKIPIATVALGSAMSAGAILFSFGTVGYRYISPEATLMIHDAASWASGKVPEIEANANEIARLNNLLYTQMARQCGHKDKNYFLNLIHSHSHADWFLNAKEVVSHGIADYVKIPTLNVNLRVDYSLD